MTVSHQVSYSDPRNPACQGEIAAVFPGVAHQQARKPLFCNRITGDSHLFVPSAVAFRRRFRRRLSFEPRKRASPNKSRRVLTLPCRRTTVKHRIIGDCPNCPYFPLLSVFPKPLLRTPLDYYSQVCNRAAIVTPIASVAVDNVLILAAANTNRLSPSVKYSGWGNLNAAHLQQAVSRWLTAQQDVAELWGISWEERVIALRSQIYL